MIGPLLYARRRENSIDAMAAKTGDLADSSDKFARLTYRSTSSPHCLGLLRSRGDLGVCAAEGTEDGHQNFDLSESRRSHEREACKGSSTSEIAEIFSLPFLLRRLLANRAADVDHQPVLLAIGAGRLTDLSGREQPTRSTLTDCGIQDGIG